MVPNGYKEIDHTADLALKVWGNDFFDLLENAAEGMYELMGIREKPGSQAENSFQIENDQKESILVDFLSECLYLAEMENHRFTSFSFKESKKEITVKAQGSVIKTIDRNIKAVTFHNLEIKKKSRGFETTITFDV